MKISLALLAGAALVAIAAIGFASSRPLPLAHRNLQPAAKHHLDRLAPMPGKTSVAPAMPTAPNIFSRMRFEPNHGQVDPRVKFFARGAGYRVSRQCPG